MNWKNIIKSLKNRDMQKRLFIVLGLVVVYRFLAHIPVPLAEPTQLKSVLESIVSSTDFGGFLNLLSGGALAQFSIVLVGLSPYITVSIIMQLLTKVVPKLEELHKDGETGRKKINQWTRMLSVPVGAVQSFTFIYVLRETILSGNTTGVLNSGLLEWIVAIVAMTTGGVLIMWLGELMSEQGIGNGISLLIFAGIISQLPQTLTSTITSLTDTSNGVLNVMNWFTIPIDPTTFYVALIVLVVSLAMLYVLVRVNEAQKIVQINYAKRINSASVYGGIKNILPVKLIVAGVIPFIFALSFMSIPTLVGQWLQATGNEEYTQVATTLQTWFSAPDQNTYTTLEYADFAYPLIYFALVIGFTYFYTSIAFNTKEISENLQKQGGFIEGIRPGGQTEKYLSTLSNRLMLFGSLILGLIAIMPFVFQFTFAQFGINAQNLAVGGTGILIVVSVGLESLRQINSRALMVTYDDYK